MHKNKAGDKRKAETDKPNKGGKPKVGDICTGCGRDNHITTECRLKHHPDWNSESKPWSQSTSGRAYAALTDPKATLPYRSVLHPLSSDGAAYLQTCQQASDNAPKGKGAKKGTDYVQAHLLFLTHHNAERIYALSTRTMLDDNSLLPIKITHANHSHTRHRALIDTGALHGNYVSREMAQTLREQGAIGLACRQRIISALNSSQIATRKFSIIVTISNEQTNENEDLLLEATEIDIDYELVIGRPTIKQFNLIDKVRSHLVCDAQHTIVAELSGAQRLANLTVVEPASKYLDPLETSDGIPIRDDEPPWQRAVNGESSPTGLPGKVDGSPDEIARQCVLLATYPDIFSAELQIEPADVEPMELKVNIEKWEGIRANQAPPRQQSMQKNAEIFRQVTALRPNVSYKNPRPDIRARSSLPRNRTASGGFVLSTSTLMIAPIERDGHSPTSSTCYDASVNNATSISQLWTALVGLIHVICELFIDDAIVFGSTFEKYLDRLRLVFDRLRRHKITLNPAKCRFGLHEVEYVGHVINHEGTKITPERREAVFENGKTRRCEAAQVLH